MIYTQTMQSIDTMSVPQEGVGGISLIKVGKDVQQVPGKIPPANAQAKFSRTLACKNDKISAQVMLSIRIDKYLVNGIFM